MMDEAFDVWARKGMDSLSDLYIDGNFASFEQLVQKYDIPKTHTSTGICSFGTL